MTQPPNLDQHTSDRYIVVGKFGRVHGVHGFLHVQAYSGDAEKLLSYTPWYANIKNTWVPLQRVEEKLESQRLFVKIAAYDSREQASLLSSILIAVQEHQLPTLAPDEYYCFELIGMDVFNSDHLHLGKVTQLIETGANDVLVVEGDKRRCIPYLPDRVVQSVSRQDRQIHVCWDEDFL